MKAHELAKLLLAGPDHPVTMADDCGSFEVNDIIETTESFNGENDTGETPRDEMGYVLDRPCVALGHCDYTPLSKKQNEEREAVVSKIEDDRKRLSPMAFAFRYASITPLTPENIAQMCETEGLIAQAPKK